MEILKKCDGWKNFLMRTNIRDKQKRADLVQVLVN